MSASIPRRDFHTAIPLRSMEKPSLIKLQIPSLNTQDITLYFWADDDAPEPMINTIPKYHGSSLKGQRSIADFFHILDYVVEAVADNRGDYKLQQLEDFYPLTPALACPPIDRSTAGNIVPGKYVIESVIGGGRIVFRNPLAFPDHPSEKSGLFSDHPSEKTGSPSKPVTKRAKLDLGDSSDHESTASEKSDKDSSSDTQGFKMRLVHRDKGCVVCLALGSNDIYESPGDSNRFEGAHIIPIAHCELWDTHGYSAIVNDPFTDPENAKNPLASPSTRRGKDTRRINSLDNGLLLCTRHHGDYDHFRISIHPSTHKIFSFHYSTLTLQGIEVKAPWDRQDPLFPPPRSSFLYMHYCTSIIKAMKANGDDYELADDDEDYEELSEPQETPIEKVGIWLDDTFSGRDITSPLDFMAEYKGNIENMLGQGQGVPGVVTGRV